MEKTIRNGIFPQMYDVINYWFILKLEIMHSEQIKNNKKY